MPRAGPASSSRPGSRPNRRDTPATTKPAMSVARSTWPILDYAAWRDTAATLQLWTQIVGKVRLALTPWLNHGWHVPLYVTARGLGTSPIPLGGEIFEIEFDFIAHRLDRSHQLGSRATGSALEPQAVADFYRRVIELLGGLGVAVRIDRDAERDRRRDALLPRTAIHSAYDAGAAHALLARAGAGRSRLQALPQPLPRQGEPGALLLGQLRPRGHTLLGPAGAAASGRRSAGCPMRSRARPIRTR